MLKEVIAFNGLEEAEAAQLWQAGNSLRQGAAGICFDQPAHLRKILLSKHGMISLMSQL